MIFRYPQLNGSAEEQLQQLKSFLYQLVDQLNFAFSAIGAAEEAPLAQQNKEDNS